MAIKFLGSPLAKSLLRNPIPPNPVELHLNLKASFWKIGIKKAYVA